MSDQDRIDALPKWGAASTEQSGGGEEAQDHRGFTAVVKIFLRTWPFLLPLVAGYWREFTLLRWSGFHGAQRAPSGRTAARQADAGWSYRYVPLLVSVLTLIGPVTGSLSFSVNWQHDLLLGATFAMALFTWLLLYLTGRRFAGVAIALVLVGIAANLFAILVVAGWKDNVQVGLVSLGCLSIWLLQYRFVNDHLQLRLRLGCHLVYYYILVGLLILLGIIGGLFTVDLLNQSILQAKPLTPFLAGFVDRPELADGAIASLELTQRRELQWVYMLLIAAIGVVTAPLARMALPYYNIWILQQINQVTWIHPG